MALLLMRRGITRIRPLSGGLARWRELGLPMAPLRDAAVAIAGPPPAGPSADPAPAAPAPAEPRAAGQPPGGA